MPHSSCLCGNVHISFSGEPLAKFMCSCLDDRKITGSLFGATNVMFSSDGLETTKGTLKTYTKVVDSGSDMTSHFCGDCGSTLYRISTGYPGTVVIKAGCIDEFNTEDGKPALELYSRSHVSWLPKIDGVQHNPEGM